MNKLSYQDKVVKEHLLTFSNGYKEFQLKVIKKNLKLKGTWKEARVYINKKRNRLSNEFQIQK